jgi:hypothetical protein
LLIERLAFAEHTEKSLSLPCIATTALKLSDDPLLILDQLLAFGNVALAGQDA